MSTALGERSRGGSNERCVRRHRDTQGAVVAQEFRAYQCLSPRQMSRRAAARPTAASRRGSGRRALDTACAWGSPTASARGPPSCPSSAAA
eukprot:4166672-Prymnesium_polylepis.2